MIATQATPDGLRHGLSRVALGAEQGRRLADLELFARVDTCISEERREAREAVRPMVARLLGSSYRRSFVHALGLEVPAEFEAIAAQRNRALTSASAHLIPDDLVEAFTWAGTSEDVARQVAAVVDMGFENIAFLPPSPWPDCRADGRGVRQGSQAAGRGLVARLMLGSAAPEFLQAAGCRQRIATWGGP